MLATYWESPWPLISFKLPLLCDKIVLINSSSYVFVGAPQPLEPDIVRRFRATVSPASGKATVFYGRSRDPQQEWAKMMTHGGKRATFDSISPMLNPDPISAFSQQAKLRSERIYESTSRKPLGRTYLAGLTNLPRGLDPDTHAFGAAIIRSASLSLLSDVKPEFRVGTRQRRSVFNRIHKLHSESNGCAITVCHRFCHNEKHVV